MLYLLGRTVLCPKVRPVQFFGVKSRFQRILTGGSTAAVSGGSMTYGLWRAGAIVCETHPDVKVDRTDKDVGCHQSDDLVEPVDAIDVALMV